MNAYDLRGRPRPQGGCARPPWGPHLTASLLLLTEACAPARFVKPLAAGQQAVSVSLGGPLINHSNATIPLPLLTAAYGYGLTPTLTGFGAVNITSALYGNAQVELGLTKQVLQPRGWVPGFSFSPAATIIYRNPDVHKLYPTLDLYAYWNYGVAGRHYAYAGLSNWFELRGTRTFDQPVAAHWLPSPLVGTVLGSGGGRWAYTLEVKVLAPNLANNFNVADYRTPFGTRGALGFYFGLTRKL